VAINSPASRGQSSPIVEANWESPATIISTCLDKAGETVVLSVYGDDVWELWPHFQQSNLAPSQKRINWTTIAAELREPCKAALYRYWRQGNAGLVRPGARTLVQRAVHLSTFCGYLVDRGVQRLRDVQPIHIANFIHHRKTVDHIKASTLVVGLASIEILYRFGTGLPDCLRHHPWPWSSAVEMAGWSGRGARQAGKTPLVPPPAFQALFAHAEQQLANATSLLDERDAGNLSTFNDSRLLLLRDACFFLIGSLTGMRCEEIVGIEIGSVRSELKDGTTFHWVRSIEHKTGKGQVEYLLPTLGVQAVLTMERWSAPLRQVLVDRMADPSTNEEASPRAPLSNLREAEVRADHRRLFLGSRYQADLVRAMSGPSWVQRMKQFAQSAGVDWALSPHQLRRIYAWTFVRHRLGNMLFLKEQFKHSSMEMTQLYAANPLQDDSLYGDLLEEINTQRVELVERWLHEDTNLSGGAGKKIMSLRAHDYPDRRALVAETADLVSIRSTGHSWCLAQDEGCGGAGLYERTRCSSCNDAVIDPSFAPVWRSIHSHQRELVDDASSLGAGAIQRVQRDLQRSRQVLAELGISLEYDEHDQQPDRG
jgi:site-specific recombinase XerD